MSDWQPSCSIELLRLRAQLLMDIRQFFAKKSVLEVETPLLSQAIGTDVYLQFFRTQPQGFFLQTSPEFAMKRLLAAGSGSIFQICKAFRQGDSGRFHNPEFTLLEWYRVGFDLSELMAEVIELLELLFKPHLSLLATEHSSYCQVFEDYTGLDALDFVLADYKLVAKAHGFDDAELLCGNDPRLWLDFLFSQIVQPQLGKQALCLINDYPACLSSLARLKIDNPQLTERLEVFYNGVELGNGYFELTDVNEQQQRFENELAERKAKNLPAIVKDERLLAALASGLPNCAGIAIGLDRLLMLISQASHIDEVLAFPVNRA